MSQTKYTIKYAEDELSDIKKQLERFIMYPDYKSLKERVTRLEKLLQSKQLKSA